MNSEIIFRGKSIRTGEWLYGDLARNEEGAFAVIPPFEMNTQNTFSDYEVYKATISQFTGLHGNNGTYIFEGDILRVNPTPYGRGVVRWHDKMAQFVVQMVGRDQWYPIADSVAEICGNIHENSDLLCAD